MEQAQRAEWLEKRRKCITGTDIGSILGINRYGSPISVFMDKIGLSEPISENEPMFWGKALEPVIAARYERDNGVALTQGTFITKKEIFGGTPDFLSPDRLIEIKTAGFYAAKSWGESGTDQIPESYLCQVQWYLMLTDREIADIPVLIGGQDYRTYTVVRNNALIDILTSSAEAFWNDCVVPQLAPPIDNSAASKQFLESFFPRSRGNMLEATAESGNMARELKAMRDEIDRLEERKALIENQLKMAIGDNDGITGDKFKVTWRSAKDTVKTDWEKLAKTFDLSPHMIKEFTSVRPGSRRFLLTFNEEK